MMNAAILFRNDDDLITRSSGDTIFSAGDPGDVMYVVTDGEVEILAQGRSLRILGEGGIFGEMALIDDEPRSATAVAKTDCRLAVVDRKRFRFLIQNAPFFALEVMRVMAERLRQETCKE